MSAAWQRDGGDDRMAELASRVHDPDPDERRYASGMLGLLWRLREIAHRDEQ